MLDFCEACSLLPQFYVLNTCWFPKAPRENSKDFCYSQEAHTFKLLTLQYKSFHFLSYNCNLWFSSRVKNSRPCHCNAYSYYIEFRHAMQPSKTEIQLFVLLTFESESEACSKLVQDRELAKGKIYARGFSEVVRTVALLALNILESNYY